MTLRHALPLIFILAATVAATVGDDAVVPAAAPAQAVAAATETATLEPAAFSLVGLITYKGEERVGEVIDFTPDAKCHDQHADTEVRQPGVREGAVIDVFVQLTTGVPDIKRETPDTPVVLDQRGCEYTPRVFGVMKKQDIEIRNSDDTLHNIHPTPRSNKEFNLAMPNEGDVRTKSFRKPEDAIVFKCDVHPWMRAHAFVLEHEYYAVTGADGKFTMDLTGLADGDYGIKIWHEVLGEAESMVKVADGTATFEHQWEE